MAEKIAARRPQGFADRRADELLMRDRLAAKISAVYQLYGFEPLETPLIEYTEALGKFLPDKDRPHDGLFSFRDDDGQWLSLRYDLTAPLARFYAENQRHLACPYRSFRRGWVFRNEKAEAGRLRQFLQFDADIVGAASPAADAELCMMGADVLEELGLRRRDYIIRLNSRKIIDGILDKAGLNPQDAPRRLIVMRAIDRLDKIGREGVRELLQRGRVDESGNFTKGAQLARQEAEFILRILECRGTPAEMLDRVEDVVQGSASGEAGIAELRQMQALFDAAGYGAERIKIDFSIVRGLEYYTGPVFEAELCAAAFCQADRKVKMAFGSVGGGGRYDGLISRFSDEAVPATGFSVSLSRLAAALNQQGEGMAAQKEFGPVIVLAPDKDKEAVASYQAIVSELRQAGIKSELYLGEGNMRTQLKYADKRRAPCIIIQGSAERRNNTAQLKDLIEDAHRAGQLADNAAWRANNPARKEIDRQDIVSNVRAILAKHR